MGITNIISNKPDLYHYTNPDAVTKIVSSRSLWARPIWDFKADDVDEYVLGLNLIVKHLKYICFKGKARHELPEASLSLFDEYHLNPKRLLAQIVAHLEYEIKHDTDPKVQIYVACVSANAPSTTNKATLRMLKEYGECIIHFNWMLPLISYAWPRPFVSSMLSRVTYEESEFKKFIMTVLNIRTVIQDVNSLKTSYLVSLSEEDRESFLATTFAIFLCSFAANIKNPSFEYEHEWRLKTINTSHPSPLLERSEVHWLRKFFKLDEDAAFSPTTPKRYIQELSFDGKMIVYPNLGILKAPPIPPEFAAQIRDVFAKLQDIEKTQGGVLGEAWQLRDLLLKLEREGFGGLGVDKAIV
jgi:hypothetical protein